MIAPWISALTFTRIFSLGKKSFFAGVEVTVTYCCEKLRVERNRSIKTEVTVFANFIVIYLIFDDLIGKIIHRLV